MAKAPLAAPLRLTEIPMAVPFQPPGYHSVTPYLTLRDARAAIDFYARAFGAELALKLDLPDGSIAHAELRIGDSILMLADENAEWGNRSPLSLGGSPVSLMVYVPDVDTAFERALDAGATRVRPVEDQFYGDRSGTLADPYGYQWTLATHVEDVSAEEAQRRMVAMLP
jgi:PhnB protein